MVWIIVYFIHKGNEYEWIANSSCTTFIISFISLVLLPTYAYNWKYTDSQVSRSGALISLENHKSSSGDINGSGFIGISMSGHSGPMTACSIVVKWENKITIETLDCNNIIFVEGDTPSVKVINKVWYYPYSLKGLGDLRWGEIDHWEIMVPPNSINKYIRFN